jgi:hypothetical protein
MLTVYVNTEVKRDDGVTVLDVHITRLLRPRTSTAQWLRAVEPQQTSILTLVTNCRNIERMLCNPPQSVKMRWSRGE